MFAGDEPWPPAVLDVGSDDYFHAHILGRAELAMSRYLDRGFGRAKAGLRVAVTGPRARPQRAARALVPGSVLGDLPPRDARLAPSDPGEARAARRLEGACRGKKRCRVTLARARSVDARLRR